MNLSEYKRRVENMHSVTGIPTYWEALQEMTAERDKWRDIAEQLYTWLAPSNDNKYSHDEGMAVRAMYDDAVREASRNDADGE